MKRKIRHAMFESNSSSTHTVSIQRPVVLDCRGIVPYYEDNFVHVNFGEFGWEVKNYYDARTKLEYAVTMVAMTERGYESEEEFYETEGFKAIDRLIRDKLNCKGVVVDDDFELRRYDDYNYMSIDGYIDHQSCEGYNSLQDFLDYYNMTLEEFIFGQNVTLHTDNDNH